MPQYKQFGIENIGKEEEGNGKKKVTLEVTKG